MSADRDDAENEAAATAATDEEISYDRFGRNFFDLVVTHKRIAGALANLRGNEIEFGPKNAGPMGLAGVEAHGEIGEVSVERIAGDLVRFYVTVPITVELKVSIAGRNYKFKADIRAGIRLTARAMAPLRIVIDVMPPSEDDVHIDFESEGLRASILNIVAGIDDELRRVVARYIAREIDKPEIRKRCDIDVAARIDKAYA